MENAVNTNGRQEKFTAKSQYFFKPEKEERGKCFIYINKLIQSDEWYFVCKYS